MDLTKLQEQLNIIRDVERKCHQSVESLKKKNRAVSFLVANTFTEKISAMITELDTHLSALPEIIYKVCAFALFSYYSDEVKCPSSKVSSFTLSWVYLTICEGIS
jgi:predicted translin family RNA/ssDNA-binding protein